MATFIVTMVHTHVSVKSSDMLCYTSMKTFCDILLQNMYVVGSLTRVISQQLVSFPEPTDPQSSATFHGLSLHGAVWNRQTCCLEPLPAHAAGAVLSPSLNQEYYVCVVPVGREQLNKKDLSWNIICCPVFVASAEASEENVSSLHFSFPMRLSKDLEACTTPLEGQSDIYFLCTL